jgi:hypothetical protein
MSKDSQSRSPQEKSQDELRAERVGGAARTKPRTLAPQAQEDIDKTRRGEKPDMRRENLQKDNRPGTTPTDPLDAPPPAAVATAELPPRPAVERARCSAAGAGPTSCKTTTARPRICPVVPPRLCRAPEPVLGNPGAAGPGRAAGGRSHGQAHPTAAARAAAGER